MDAGSAGLGSPFVVLFVNGANALIDGGTHQCLGSIARQCYGSGVSMSLGAELSISGSIVRNVTIRVEGNGGIGVFSSTDSLYVDRTKSVGVALSTNTVTGSTGFQAGGGHAVFLANGTNHVADHNTVTGVGLGMACKRSTTPEMHHNAISDATSVYTEWKACDTAYQHDNTITAHAGFGGTMFAVQTDPSSGLTSSGTIQNDHFVVNGNTGTNFVIVDTSNTAVFVGNDFHLTSGSITAGAAWRWQGTNTGSFATWQATHGPTDTSNIP
jgi:hypothetical protein